MQGLLARDLAYGGLDDVLGDVKGPYAIPVTGLFGEVTLRLFGAGAAHLGEPRAVAGEHGVAMVHAFQDSPHQTCRRPLIGDAEKRPGALAVPVHQTSLDQQAQMAGDAWLGLAQNGHEFGNGQLGVSEQGEQAQAGDLACRFKRIQGRGEGG